MKRKQQITRASLRPRFCKGWRSAYLCWHDRLVMTQCSHYLAALWLSLNAAQQKHALFALELWEELSNAQRKRVWYQAVRRCSREPEQILRFSDPPASWSPFLRQVWRGEPQNLALQKPYQPKTERQ